MFEKIKQMKNLRDQAKQMKGALDQETVNASANSGKVNLVMNGSQEIVSIDINPELLNPEKKEELEKSIREAFEDAHKKVQNLMVQKFQSSGFNLPGL